MVTIDQLKNVQYVDKIYSSLQILNQRDIRPKSNTIDLRTSELRLFSQNGEDGIIHAIINAISPKEAFFVEFGIGDGWSCNTRMLAEVYDWAGLYFEVNEEDYTLAQERYNNSTKVTVANEAITRKNINRIFKKYNVPKNLGLLSIDIDGQDYWVWKALSNEYRPDIIIMEYNSNHGLKQAIVEKKDLNQNLPLSSTWGASLKAITKLGKSKGYTLIHTEMAGVNAFLIKEELLAKTGINFIGIKHRSPNFGLRGRNHPNEVIYPDGKIINRPTVIVKKIN